MHHIVDFFKNPFAITAISSWLIAQVMKFFIHAIVNKKFELSRLFGDGGMPSGHSATVCSLAAYTGLVYGFGGFEFAATTVLAVIVCHDAMGVRLETGKQAILLNEILKSFTILHEKKLPEVKLKEFVGHSPVQVSAGVILGITNAFIMYHFVF